MVNYSEYENILNELKRSDNTAYQHLDEEINIVVHKLKYIPTESRPGTLLISDLRTLSQDFSILTKEALTLAGGIWMDVSNIERADKIIVVGNTAQLYRDLPVFLQDIHIAPAVLSNEIYIIQQDGFGTQSPIQFLTDVEILAEIIQPKYFIYGRNGEDWLRFDVQ